jgi:FkbM family methyltransferase
MKQLAQKFLGRFGYGLRKLSALEETFKQLRPFTPFVRDISFLDASFQMWIANPDAADWYDQEHSLECGELHALRTLAKPGDCILEIGSHHGFTGMLLSKFVGQTGCVYSVEAHPHNAMIAQAQLGLNRAISNLQFANFAASNVPGVVRINPSHNSSITSAIEDSIEVKAITGDMLDAQNGPFNFLKIDVEGYELEVLEGCQKLLARAPKIALEIHMETIRKRGQTLAAVFDLIDIHRYEGEMSIRPDKFREVVVFNPASIPEDSITNVLLKPRQKS